MGDKIRDYKDLEAWREAMELCAEVYRLAERLPAQEQYGLRSQMCRAAVSIPANIAEGYGRGSRADYSRFVKVARGSAAELETCLLLAEQLGLLHAEMMQDAMDKLHGVRRLVHGLTKALDNKR
ncbi:MAG: four helix bundle protein [Armatimonadetes bacterium]|nr:four helix bundle protein [Armatimonadota bacterium]